MNWWGNSLEKAVGFSNIATSALKKAQKKIDKVLDIPIEDDISIISRGKKFDNEKEIEIDVCDTPLTIDSNITKTEDDFSDIDLTSPKNWPTNLKNANIETSFDSRDEICQRLGDWCTEDSLTASQFEPYNNVLTDSRTIKVINSCEPIQDIAMCTSTSAFDHHNFVENNQLTLFSNRNSHVSISSDCTTSTIKKNSSDIESSGHTDDFTFSGNDSVLNSSFNGSTFKEDETMIESFRRVSSDTFNVEGISMKDESSIDSPKENISFQQQLSVICHNKDEIESNTTSSDIELVSCATSNNGENQLPSQNSFKYFVSDNMKHCRSASGSSMSICKIDNGDYPNDSEMVSHELAGYHNKLSDLSRILDIRESKIIQLSRENINLRDTINNLTRQIEQVSERQETDATDINALTREFTTRLSEAEKRYQIANKERDQLKKQVTELERMESQQIDKVIKEKEEQLASLLEEGEILAQNQLKANNTIKKLRNLSKEKESENLVLSQKITKLELEMNYLKKVLDNKEDNERKHIEGITQLTKVVEKMEKDNLQFSTQNEVLQERNCSLESALNKTTQEISNLKKQMLEIESEKNSIQNDYKNLMNQQSNKIDALSDFRSKAEQNEKEVNLLQKRLLAQSRESSNKEEEYNSRISYLQERLAEMEQRNEELSEAASVATRPVIRQLEAIQNTCAIHTSNWEHIEKNLNIKIIDLQQKLSLSEETTNSYKEQLQSRDIQSNSLREEKKRIMSQYNEEYNSRQLLMDEKIILESKLSQLQQDSKKEKDFFTKKIKEVEFNLLNVQNSLEVEKQTSNNLSSKLTNLQILMNKRQISAMTHEEKREQRSRTISDSSLINDLEPDDSVSMVSNGSLLSKDIRNSKMSLYDSLRQQGVAVMMEHLEASLKQKEGQINKLQIELVNLRRSRESVIEEMSQLTQTIEKLESTVKNQQDEIGSMADLKNRYNALLQMYGEKMEECEELRMDIIEVKEVYRSHIDMLSKES